MRPCCPTRTFVPYTQGHPDSTPSSSFPRSQLPENPGTQEPVQDVKHRTEHTHTHTGAQRRVHPHHGVESQWMVASRGSRGVVPIPEVL